MKASVVLITTNLPNPEYSLLKRAMKTVRALKSDFVDEYILSVDIFGHPGAAKKDFFIDLAGAGWKVVFGKSTGKRSMAENQIRGLLAAENDMVLCCEDDSIITKIPSAFHVSLAERLGVEFITYNCNSRCSDKYINDSGNYITTGDDSILVKGNMPGNYQIAFPGLITKKEYLLKMHEWAEQLGCRKKIEGAMSTAWRALYLEKRIGIYLNKIDFTKPVTQERLHKEAHLIYWNNDEGLRHQSLLGGTTVWT